MFKTIRFVSVLIILLFAQAAYGQVILEGAGVVQGLVRDSLGIEPLDGAIVEAFHEDTIYYDTTDSQGRYTLVIPLEDGQDTSVVNLRASKTGFLADSVLGVYVYWGEITFVNFDLRVLAGPIWGFIINNEFLEPLANVLVSTVVDDTTISFVTDSTGRYSLDVKYCGIYDVDFVCDDYKAESVNSIGVNYAESVRVDMAMDRVNWYVDRRFGHDYIGRGSDARPFKTIQRGIDITNTGDTVLVSPDDSSYTGSGNTGVRIGVNSTTREWIVVKSKEDNEFPTIDCEGLTSAFVCSLFVMDNRTVISGFTIKNGYGVGGGISIKAQSSPTIEHCRFINCESHQLGGGVAIEGRSNPIIRFCEFRDNFAVDGGAIGIYESSPTIDHCTIIDNIANRGGGIAILDVLPDTLPVSMTNCIVRGNIDTSAAGQVTVKSSITEINYCDIEGTIWPGQGNFDGDPYHCHADSFNFHLASNSCCMYSGQDSTFVGAYGLGCDDMGEISGTVTLCGAGDLLFGVNVYLTTSTGKFRSTSTDSSGHYRILIPETPTLIDIHFSHPEPTIVSLDIEDYYVLPGDSGAPLDVCLGQSGCNPYVVGDVNGNSFFNGLDIIYGVRHFSGDTSAVISDSCACPPDSGWWYMVGDVNASCSYNGLDITYGVGILKGQNPTPLPCPDCPGAILSPAAISSRMPDNSD